MIENPLFATGYIPDIVYLFSDSGDDCMMSNHSDSSVVFNYI